MRDLLAWIVWGFRCGLDWLEDSLGYIGLLSGLVAVFAHIMAAYTATR